MMTAALKYFLETLEDSSLGDRGKYYLNEQQNGVICKLRNIPLDDSNKRSFDTEEVVLSLSTIRRRKYHHGRDFLVRPETENITTEDRKDLMLYL